MVQGAVVRNRTLGKQSLQGRRSVHEQTDSRTSDNPEITLSTTMNLADRVYILHTFTKNGYSLFRPNSGEGELGLGDQ